MINAEKLNQWLRNKKIKTSEKETKTAIPLL